jgi:glycosyltransferase involved in cell wall biosynthesis
MYKSHPVWIPLWSDAEGRTSKIEDRRLDDGAVARLRQARGWRDDELVVMYSGNMGLGHRFGEILEVMGKRAEPARFVFFGGGKRRREIERFVAEHPESAVELHDYAPAEDLEVHLRSADVHLASLAAEWTGTMVPSKLQGIFHAARPVIFIGDGKSSIGQWVTESGGGWVVAPGDVKGLERAIEEARDREARESRGHAAKAFAEANFDKQTNVRWVAEIFVRGRA